MGTMMTDFTRTQSTELGKSATEISMMVEINAPIEKVWKEFVQIGDIYLNSPTVASSYLSSEITEGVGATRHMEMSLIKGATLDERVIKWDEASKYMALEVYRITRMPGVKTMGGDFGLEAKGDRTILRSTLNYSMTNSLLGFMNTVFMKRVFIKLWRSVLAGYKKHIETGIEITNKTKLEMDQVILIQR